MTLISQLQFTTIRAPNLLAKHGITTVEQLLSMTDDDLLSIRGISYATLHDVEHALKMWRQSQ